MTKQPDEYNELGAVYHAKSASKGDWGKAVKRADDSSNTHTAVVVEHDKGTPGYGLPDAVGLPVDPLTLIVFIVLAMICIVAFRLIVSPIIAGLPTF